MLTLLQIHKIREIRNQPAGIYIHEILYSGLNAIGDIRNIYGLIPTSSINIIDVN